jgi:hypothetical protein
MIGKLPRHRRDITQYMVDQSQASLFVLCVRLGLCKEKHIDRHAMGNFSRMLFKRVARRHTHLWDIVDEHVGAGTVEDAR